jgi:GntR family transcriptional repressor for pyruvate dehydrogenase complex
MVTKLNHPRIGTIQSKIRPITKTLISDKIVEHLMKLITEGGLKPGQVLPSEEKLRIYFGAGRSSLREALRCLCIVGVLTRRVGEGISVAEGGGKLLRKFVEWRIITEQHDIEDLMQVRIALESATAAGAARQVKDESIAKLRFLLTKMKSATDDKEHFAALDLEFHLYLAAASENLLLSNLISTIRNQLEETLNRVLPLPSAMPLSLKEHIAIVDAIACSDPERACEAMQHHLSATLARYHHALGGNRLPAVAFGKKTSIRPNKTKKSAI